MTNFNDRNGKKWTLDLTVGSARKVKADCDLDLVNIIVQKDDGGIETPVLDTLTQDPYKLVSVLFSLCEAQARSDGVSPEAFAELFDAPTIEGSTDALIKEIINFSPAMKRKMLQTLWEMAGGYMKKQEQELDKTLSDPHLIEEVEAVWRESFISSRGSSE